MENSKRIIVGYDTEIDKSTETVEPEIKTASALIASGTNDLIYKIVSDYSRRPSSSDFYRTEAGCKQIGYFEGNSNTPNKIFGESYLYFEIKNKTRIEKGDVLTATLMIPIYLSPYVMNSNGYFSLYGTNDSKWKDTGIDWSGNKPTVDSDVLANAKPQSKEGLYYLEFDITSALNSDFAGFVVKGNHVNDFYNGGWQNSVYVPTDDNASKVELSVLYREANHVRGGKSIRQTCNLAGIGAIDLFTGGLTFANDVLNLDGVRFPMDISLVYNTNRCGEMTYGGYTFGLGWRPNFMQTLESAELPIGSFVGGDDYECYVYTDALGNKQEISTRYYKDYTNDGKTYKLYGRYKENTGLKSEISNENYVLTKENGKLVLTDTAGNKLRFTAGMLTSVETAETAQKSAFKMTIEYADGKISVKDANNRTAEFCFTERNGLNLLSSVEYENTTLRNFTFAAGTLGYKLTELTAPFGKVTFGYDATHECLNKVTDPSGCTLEYKYKFEESRPISTGYSIKSSTEKIGYDSDPKKGMVDGGVEKILDDVSIEYDSEITGGRFGGWGAMKNLTSVSSLGGVKSYCYFKHDGTLLATIDGKGNMEVFSSGYETAEMNVDGATVMSNTVKQSSASVLYTADEAAFDMPYETNFAGTFFSDSREIVVIDGAYAAKGWYVFAACMQGCVASGKHFNKTSDAESDCIPYLALHVSKTLSGGETVEDYALFDPSSSAGDKSLMAFLPYYVGDDVQSLKVRIATKDNPNYIVFPYMTVLRAAQGSCVTVKDGDAAVSESYARGSFTSAETDIAKRGNVRQNKIRRGSSSAITAKTTYDETTNDDGTYKFPERVIKENDGISLEKTYEYDVCGNVTGESVRDMTTASVMKRGYAYETSGLVKDNAIISVTDEDGNNYLYGYDNYGFMRQAAYPKDGQALQYKYDGAKCGGIEGLLSSVKTLGNSSNFVEASENKLSYNLGYLTKLADGKEEYDFKYDGFGRMIEISVGGKKYIEAKFTDGGTNIDGVTGAVSKTAVVYEDKATIFPPYCGDAICGRAYAGKESVRYESIVYASYYDKYGELIKVRYAEDKTLDYLFTSANDYVTFEETVAGNKRTVRRTEGTTVFEYVYDRSTGEFLDSTETEAGTEKLKLEITEKDDFGRTSGVKYATDAAGEQTYSYEYRSDYDDGIKTVTLPNGSKSTLKTDAFGRVSAHTVRAGVVFDDRYYYKSNGSFTTPLLESEDLTVGGDVSAVYKYTYDANGNITEIRGRNNELHSSYEYDGLNRLIRENVAGSTITVYFYDDYGNLNYKKMFSYEDYIDRPTSVLRSNMTAMTIMYGYDTTGNMKRLCSYGSSKKIAYDYLGNPKQWFKHPSIDARVGYDLSWSKVSRLTGVTDLDTKEKYEYTYNHRGIRTGKKVGNTVYRYYLDGTSIVAETRTTGGKVDVLKYYYGATGLVGFNYNGTDYYYKKNMRGDIVRIYDASGEPCGQYRYDAWGKCTVEWDPNGIAEINPFRYRSYYLDNETGLCYLNSRYYDAHIGRFLSPDSPDYLDPETINGLNLYAYCYNNPVNYYDPSGHVVISLIVALMIAGGVIGAIVGGLIAGMTSYDNGDRGWSLFGHIMLGALFGGAVGVAAGFVIGVLGPTIGGMGAIVLGDTMAMSGAFAAVGVAVEVLTAAGAGALVAAGAGALGNVMFSKQSKISGKQGATNKPSWVNKDMVDPSLSAQQNATNFMNEKYGIGNWKSGADSEFNKIKKWLARTIFRRR